MTFLIHGIRNVKSPLQKEKKHPKPRISYPKAFHLLYSRCKIKKRNELLAKTIVKLPLISVGSGLLQLWYFLRKKRVYVAFGKKLKALFPHTLNLSIALRSSH